MGLSSEAQVSLNVRKLVAVGVGVTFRQLNLNV